MHLFGKKSNLSLSGSFPTGSGGTFESEGRGAMFWHGSRGSLRGEREVGENNPMRKSGVGG